ncbi:MAG: outer-membrane lipoprotein carrier protein LolA [Clostridium sp.]|nr:outer-membrane lipoprotein carrier protein LolA [Clostridium sp.]
MGILRTILATIILASITLPSAAAGSGDDLLDRVVAWCKAKGSIETDYTVTSGEETMAGTMIVNGTRFAVRSAMIDSWYDGKTQWTYNPNVNEVTLTEPEGEELQQINPFAIIDAFRHAYNVELAPQQESSKFNTLVLTPKQGNQDIRRVDISVPKEALYPSRIVIRMSSGEVLTLNMRRFVRGVAYDDSTFRYDPSSHPKAKTVDLR